MVGDFLFDLAAIRGWQMQHAAPQSAISGDAGPMGPEQAAGAQAGAAPFAGVGPETVTPVVREGRKVGRNEPCPCGSGKKYKHCHGQLAREA